METSREKGVDYPDNQYEELSEKVEATLRKKMLGLIKDGKDVILDFSFGIKKIEIFTKNN